MINGKQRVCVEGGAEGREMKRNRRALSVIDQNLNSVLGSQPYPSSLQLINTQKCVIYEDNIQRPITRKFDAQNAPSQAQQQQQSEKSHQHSIQDCKPSPDLPVPMSLETPQVDEVEMEDIYDEEEEPVLDIDARDSKDPLAVTDYVHDLYSYYRKMEACANVSQDYMTHQLDINHKMRAILIDWLIEVHYKFELRDETLFLTVSLIDRFLARQSVVRKKLQLVGLVAMLLACKYEEVSVPVVDDLIFISDKAYTRLDLLHMERMMLNTLQFNMSFPTPFVFLRRFLKVAESDKKLGQLSSYLIELSLVEYEMNKFTPSLLAAAAVYTAQCSLYGFSQWSKTCEFYTNYSEHQLLECSRLIVSYHQNAGSGKLTGVHRKYSTSKFGYATRCQPALFILQHDNHA